MAGRKMKKPTKPTPVAGVVESEDNGTADLDSAQQVNKVVHRMRLPRKRLGAAANDEDEKNGVPAEEDPKMEEDESDSAPKQKKRGKGAIKKVNGDDDVDSDENADDAKKSGSDEEEKEDADKIPVTEKEPPKKVGRGRKAIPKEQENVTSDKKDDDADTKKVAAVGKKRGLPAQKQVPVLSDDEEKATEKSTIKKRGRDAKKPQYNDEDDEAFEKPAAKKTNRGAKKAQSAVAKKTDRPSRKAAQVGSYAEVDEIPKKRAGQSKVSKRMPKYDEDEESDNDVDEKQTKKRAPRPKTSKRMPKDEEDEESDNEGDEKPPKKRAGRPKVSKKTPKDEEELDSEGDEDQSKLKDLRVVLEHCES